MCVCVRARACVCVSLALTLTLTRCGGVSTALRVAIVYGCNPPLSSSLRREGAQQGLPIVWIISRTPQLPAAYPYDVLVSKIASTGINVTTVGGMTPTVQAASCEY